ncbi:MAG TPA: phosphopantetheine-binding protein [Opitutales bacterium]|nr:phosphopantetheine-binding protein [Opitutales bacterium]
MSQKLSAEAEQALREQLKRCPPETLEAALCYRTTGNPDVVSVIVLGILERFLDPEVRPRLRTGGDSLRIFDDLGIDSLTMVEVVMLVEEVLQIKINNEELRDLRTVGDVKTYIDCRVRGLPLPERPVHVHVAEILTLMPHQPPFLFVQEAALRSHEARGVYKIAGDEFFLEGHFKNNPVLPASIMLEALGQLAVLFLLKAKRPELTAPVAAARIFFTACDGVRCQRVCKPGDLLSLVVKPKRIKHPLAMFEGHITCGNDRVAFAEEIALTFDFMRPEELAAAEPAGENSATAAPPPRQSEMSVNLPR